METSKLTCDALGAVAPRRPAPGRTSDAQIQRRLVARTRRVRDLGPATTQAMWALFHRYYANSSWEKFSTDLRNKDDVILLYDRADRSLRGFSTLGLYEQTVEGRRVRAVFSGDTIVDRAYWGQSALHGSFARYILKKRLSRPTEPLYWFLISKGYKTYLLLSRNFANYWPRYESPTPAWEQSLIDQLSRNRYGSDYDPSRGLIVRADGRDRLRDGVAPIDADARRAPDVQFFAARNPGHARGDELCCAGRVDAAFIVKAAMRLWVRNRARPR